jgi:hypothetical protein
MTTESPSMTSTLISPESIIDGGTAKIMNSVLWLHTVEIFF